MSIQGNLIVPAAKLTAKAVVFDAIAESSRKAEALKNAFSHYSFERVKQESIQKLQGIFNPQYCSGNPELNEVETEDLLKIIYCRLIGTLNKKVTEKDIKLMATILRMNEIIPYYVITVEEQKHIKDAATDTVKNIATLTAAAGTTIDTVTQMGLDTSSAIKASADHGYNSVAASSARNTLGANAATNVAFGALVGFASYKALVSGLKVLNKYKSKLSEDLKDSVNRITTFYVVSKKYLDDIPQPLPVDPKTLKTNQLNNLKQMCNYFYFEKYKLQMKDLFTPEQLHSRAARSDERKHMIIHDRQLSFDNVDIRQLCSNSPSRSPINKDLMEIVLNIDCKLDNLTSQFVIDFIRKKFDTCKEIIEDISMKMAELDQENQPIHIIEAINNMIPILDNIELPGIITLNIDAEIKKIIDFNKPPQVKPMPPGPLLSLERVGKDTQKITKAASEAVSKASESASKAATGVFNFLKGKGGKTNKHKNKKQRKYHRKTLKKRKTHKRRR